MEGRNNSNNLMRDTTFGLSDKLSFDDVSSSAASLCKRKRQHRAGILQQKRQMREQQRLSPGRSYFAFQNSSTVVEVASSSSTSSPSSSSCCVGSVLSLAVPPLSKEELRRKKNRESAERSRMRKLARIDELTFQTVERQLQLKDLLEENARLQGTIGCPSGAFLPQTFPVGPMGSIITANLAADGDNSVSMSSGLGSTSSMTCSCSSSSSSSSSSSTSLVPGKHLCTDCDADDDTSISSTSSMAAELSGTQPSSSMVAMFVSATDPSGVVGDDLFDFDSDMDALLDDFDFDAIS